MKNRSRKTNQLTLWPTALATFALAVTTLVAPKSAWAQEARIFDLHRPYLLGVMLEMSSDEPDSRGVRVLEVVEGGPADEVGIQAGDIILSLNSHSLSDPLDDRSERRFRDDFSLPGQRLQALMREVEDGEPLEVVLERDGETMTLSVTPESQTARLKRYSEEMKRYGEGSLRLGEGSLGRVEGSLGRVEEALRRAPRIITNGTNSTYGWLGERHIAGLELVDINPELGAYFGTDEGLLVTDIEEGSTLGLRSGDVIMSVDGRRATSSSQLRRILRSYTSDEEIEFTIQRDGGETTVVGTIR